MMIVCLTNIHSHSQGFLYAKTISHENHVCVFFLNDEWMNETPESNVCFCFS